ncbi:MAG: hypothetical protein H6993_16475 [Pseudomonadales bacterium]|nr:hypothetical protein [Pseudomonadales bacterium]MCP5185562.1 hypothetical protein [Pseudomonadales bacterium]
MTWRLTLTALLLAFISSCGGGAGGGVSIIDRSGVYVGQVTAFGSVFVNGVEFDTGATTFTIDDQPSSEDKLQVGQIVRVSGSLAADGTTGTADALSTDPWTRGLVTAVNAASGTVTVLGTTIRVDGDTRFLGNFPLNGIAGLLIGDRVEVHAIEAAGGEVLATLIQRTTDTRLEIHGRVSQLDSGSRLFAINGLQVDYTNAQQVDLASGLAMGDLVEANGEDLAGATLIATRLQRESGAVFDANDAGVEVEIEGVITRFDSATDFRLGDTRVTTTGATTFTGGTAADLREDRILTAEGRIDANGRLAATHIILRQASNLEIEAPVEAVNAQAGTVTVLGIRFSITDTTALADESPAEIRRFSLADLATGDTVEIRGTAAGGQIVARELVRQEAEDEQEIRGAVTGIANPEFRIQAAVIRTDAQTEFEASDRSLSAAEFFQRLGSGDVVEVEGRVVEPGILLARKVER